jgi:hypothetical protein
MLKSTISQEARNRSSHMDGTLLLLLPDFSAYNLLPKFSVFSMYFYTQFEAKVVSNT